MDELEDEEACYCETDDECEEYTITLGTMDHDAENKENANSGPDNACPLAVHFHGERGGSDIGGRRRGEETEGHAVVDGDKDGASARERESCDGVAGDEGGQCKESTARSPALWEAWKAAGALRDGSGERERKKEGATPDGRDASSYIDMPGSKKVVHPAGDMLAKQSPKRKPTELHSRASVSASVCVSCGGCAPTCGCAWQRLRQQQAAEKAAGAAEKGKAKMLAAVPCGRNSGKYVP